VKKVAHAREAAMADNKQNVGEPDRSRLSGSEDYEVRYFADKHGISMDQAHALIRQHGSNRESLDQADGLEARLQRAERSLAAHDMLLRAVLTHIAFRDPQALPGMVGGLAHSRRYDDPGPAGALTREVAQELTTLMEDVADSLRRR
jgi:hypothetical protein